MPFKRARVLREVIDDNVFNETQDVSMPFKRARVLRGVVSVPAISL